MLFKTKELKLTEKENCKTSFLHNLMASIAYILIIIIFFYLLFINIIYLFGKEGRKIQYAVILH